MTLTCFSELINNYVGNIYIPECCNQINEEEEAMLPAIEARAAPEALQGAQEEQGVDEDDDDVPILQQVLFEASLVRLSPSPPDHL